MQRKSSYIRGSVFALLLCSVSSHAQSRAVLEARAAKIDRQLKTFRHVTRDLPDRSTEGGTLDFYFSASTPRKLVARYYGETGTATEEFYFHRQRLFLMRRRESRYDKPFGKIIATVESRSYFAAGQSLSQRDREILQDARELLAIAKRPS